MRASFIGTLLLLVGTACPAPPDGRSACYFQAEDDPRWTDDLIVVLPSSVRPSVSVLRTLSKSRSLATLSVTSVSI